MGLLDEAIREHLELKRRHGASDQELRQQEDEALGPARREVSPPPEDEQADAAPALAVGDERGRGVEEPARVSDRHEPEAVEAGRATAEEPVVRDEPTRVVDGDEPEPLEEQSERLEEEHEPREDEPDAQGARRPEERGEEDVLEETPDFLQETPEHDRLWFEQKPPRDFDFE